MLYRLPITTWVCSRLREAGRARIFLAGSGHPATYVGRAGRMPAVPGPAPFPQGAISRLGRPSSCRLGLSRWALRINESEKTHSSARSMRFMLERQKTYWGVGWKEDLRGSRMGIGKANGVWVSNLGGHNRGDGDAGGGFQGLEEDCRIQRAIAGLVATETLSIISHSLCLQTARADSTSSQIEPSSEGIGAELILKPYSRLGGTYGLNGVM